MKFEMPKIVKELPIGEYAPELEAVVKVKVWVNPPRGQVLAQVERNLRMMETAHGLRAEIEARGKLSAVSNQLPGESNGLKPIVSPEEAISQREEELTQRLGALGEETEVWLAEMWSQGGEVWTAEEVRELADGLVDTDPGLFNFMQDKTLRLILEHRGAVKKK